MSSAADVIIHPSQFPDQVRRDLLASLRTRRVNHKFHYDSVKQTQKWLALHQEHSPSRTDRDCAATYDRAFREAVQRITAAQVQVIGLGCGGGQKDCRLLKRLFAAGKRTGYTPSDVAVAMTLVAREAALQVLPGQQILPLICDLANADDLPALLAEKLPSRVPRVLTFFGMIPNFEPGQIMRRLAALVRQGDWLLFSANLAPGDDYAAGVRHILPQYDNPLTRDWLTTFLSDLGVEPRDGVLKFSIETGANGLRRVEARFVFRRAVEIAMEAEQFKFRSGESIRLFFSYRYTPARAARMLQRYGLEVCDQWVTRSGEEGVFLVRRQ